jgi:hypothetical protein
MRRTRGGTTLTRELEEALANEAEADYDLTKARPVPRTPTEGSYRRPLREG